MQKVKKREDISLPELLTLETWARKTGWENAEPVPLPAESEGPG